MIKTLSLKEREENKRLRLFSSKKERKIRDKDPFPQSKVENRRPGAALRVTKKKFFPIKPVPNLPPGNRRSMAKLLLRHLLPLKRFSDTISKINF